MQNETKQPIRDSGETGRAAISSVLATVAVAAHDHWQQTPPRGEQASVAGHDFFFLVETGGMAIAAGWEVAAILAAVITMGRLLPQVLARAASLSACVLLPSLTWLNSFFHHWTGEAILSPVAWRLLTQHAGELAGHLSVNVMLGVAKLGVGVVAILGGVFLAIRQHWRAPLIEKPFALAVILAGLGGILAWSTSYRKSLSQTPSRHPLLLWGFVETFRSSQTHASTSTLQTSIPRETPNHSLDWMLESVNTQVIRSPLPDVLIVIAESFRRELLDPSIMPSLAEFASHGIVCRQHYSSGNATTHGMFSLVTGVDALEYGSPLRYDPPLNRWLHQAGYEIGFFAAHDDWVAFAMDGFIGDEHFDEFVVSKNRGLDSDRQTVEMTLRFLDRGEAVRGEETEPRPPRCAVVYLYTTHAPYRSYADDHVFQPAADERFVIPYSSSRRDEVWNRYRNSARSLDRLLKPLLDRERITIVTGDHGEAFLEDGTIGHGVKLSTFQNMTSAIIVGPQVEPRELQSPTSHTDLLPTLMMTLGLELNGLRGAVRFDLRREAEETLRQRVVMTRDYLRSEFALIADDNELDDSVFAIRAAIDDPSRTVRVIGFIDERGDLLADGPVGSLNDAAASRAVAERLLERWVQQRAKQFPAARPIHVQRSP